MANTTVTVNTLVIADVDALKPAPKLGMEVYCLDTKKRYFSYDGITWVETVGKENVSSKVDDSGTHALLKALIAKVEALTEVIQLIQGSL